MTSGAARSRSDAVDPVLVLLLAGIAGYLGLHFFEPSLAITWSYAHLGRWWPLPVLSAALVLALPATARWWARRPVVRLPFGSCSWPVLVVWFVSLWLVAGLVGMHWPAPDVCPDVYYLRSALTRRLIPGRWYLAMLSWQLAYDPFRSLLTPVAFLRIVNPALVAATMLLSVGCARRLAPNRGGATAILLLFWTAFGNLQLAAGYTDIYPIVQCGLVLYVWSALRYLRGEGAVVWPVAVATLVPFFYMGLVLVTPSVAVLAVVAWRRPGGRADLMRAAAVGVVLLGLATTVVVGRPFALGRVLQIMGGGDNIPALGLSPTSTLLPPWYLASVGHLREFVHGLLLVDGIGVLLCSTCGIAVMAREIRRPSDPRLWLLAALLAPCLGYMFVMDPIWGPYSDWDLFSYLAVPTSLLGSYALLVWGRGRRATAWLVGLALAASSVHVLARFNALDVDLARHRHESPFHLPGFAPGS